VLALIPLLPFLGFLVNAFLGKRLPKALSGGIAVAAMLASFAVAVTVSWPLFGLTQPGPIVEQTLYTWIASGDFHVPLAFRVDRLTVLMILVVTGIGSLIHIYSTGYMQEETDSEYARFFSYLNLFAAFMLILVLGANALVMFIGWEGVGLCSYLLIGYYYKKRSANDAGKKAFVVNRIGDFAFILGMALLFVTFGTLDFLEVGKAVTPMATETSFGVLSLIALLFFIGATGKSAQIPLFTWLPDAMEGPTPVSALIHAATMVTAGVYMIGRNAELFAHAPITLQVVAVIGTLTALMAGTIGLVQNDIKRVLAYSTVSQLGYMFLAMGVGAFSAGIFHLYTHAFFKALMFLGSGAVIHALHGEQDIRKMGGLKKDLPITYWTFLIGGLAIAGVPFLSGFFSKDEILFQTFYGGHTLLWVVGAATSLLTAIYMFRLIFLTFHGPRFSEAAAHAGHGHAPAKAALGGHGGHGHDAHGHDAHGHDAHGHGGHLHDAPPAMAFPLIVLAIGSILAGYVGVPHAIGGSNAIETFLESSFHPGSQAGAHAAASLHGESAATAAAHAGEAPAAAEHGAAAAETALAEQAATAGEHGGEHDPGKTSLELTLMGVSSALAFIGIGTAFFFFLKSPATADAIASSFSGVHKLLLNKYYVDELYDAVVVQPIKRISETLLWKGVDAGLIDGTVNGTGTVIRGSGALLRLLQTGSIRTYAASLFLGVVIVLGYYLTR
jgi:NADH-quinone oxidoreductase subunit L